MTGKNNQKVKHNYNKTQRQKKIQQQKNTITKGSDNKIITTKQLQENTITTKHNDSNTQWQQNTTTKQHNNSKIQ